MTSRLVALIGGLALGGLAVAPLAQSVRTTAAPGKALLMFWGEAGARPSGAPRAQGVPVASGPYTASQAERGKVVYEQNCSTCHGASLRGGANEFGAPALAGPFFYEKWTGRPLEELFRYAVENMPPDQTKLSEAAYLDVMAYVLQILKHPAGNTDLTADSPAMKRGIEAPK